MSWVSHTSKGTIKGRENSIALQNRYMIEWEKYCDIDDKRSGEFKYLILQMEI